MPLGKQKQLLGEALLLRIQAISPRRTSKILGMFLELDNAQFHERVQEAKDLARKEQRRKADLFGAENVYRTTKHRGPLLAVPALLAQTREEEAAARKAGLDRANPKAYQFIKESLDALEAQCAARPRARRRSPLARRSRRLAARSPPAAARPWLSGTRLPPVQVRSQGARGA